mmetsp:Transcript_94564/g.282403  ORF Transcript_94564/g.282403 Transcript_94564/m.282403 type:complete len:211 (-) Transcript_94564:407-1039(-)
MSEATGQHPRPKPSNSPAWRTCRPSWAPPGLQPAAAMACLSSRGLATCSGAREPGPRLGAPGRAGLRMDFRVRCPLQAMSVGSPPLQRRGCLAPAAPVDPRCFTPRSCTKPRQTLSRSTRTRRAGRRTGFRSARCLLAGPRGLGSRSASRAPATSSSAQAPTPWCGSCQAVPWLRPTPQPAGPPGVPRASLSRVQRAWSHTSTSRRPAAP